MHIWEVSGCWPPAGVAGRALCWVEGGWGSWKDPWVITNVGGSLYPTGVAFTCCSPEAPAEVVFRARLPCQLVLNAIIVLHLFIPLHSKPYVVSFAYERLLAVVTELSSDMPGLFQHGHRGQ